MKRRAAYKNENEDFGFAALLKVCAHKKDLREGTRLHGDILKRGLLDKSPYISSSLVSMYAKCGALSKAQKLHDDLHIRSIVSWNALIVGYIRHDAYASLMEKKFMLQSPGSPGKEWSLPVPYL
mgnify:CR=1 FL=1